MVNNSLIGSVQAAELLGISRTHLLRHVRNGLIEFSAKVPGPVGAYLFDPAVIDQFAAKRNRK